MLVDLDAEKGITPRMGKDGKMKEDKHRVRITYSTSVRLEALRAYLDRQADFGREVLQGISEHGKSI